MLVYPNANNGIDFTWSLRGLVPNSQAVVTLFDMDGRALKLQGLTTDNSGNLAGIGFAGMRLRPGQYLLKVRNEGKEIVERLLVR